MEYGESERHYLPLLMVKLVIRWNECDNECLNFWHDVSFYPVNQIERRSSVTFIKGS